MRCIPTFGLSESCRHCTVVTLRDARINSPPLSRQI